VKHTRRLAGLLAEVGVSFARIRAEAGKRERESTVVSTCRNRPLLVVGEDGGRTLSDLPAPDTCVDVGAVGSSSGGDILGELGLCLVGFSRGGGGGLVGWSVEQYAKYLEYVDT